MKGKYRETSRTVRASSSLRMEICFKGHSKMGSVRAEGE
jgi:hypothetical protein